jgi:hypothetical protein
LASISFVSSSFLVPFKLFLGAGFAVFFPAMVLFSLLLIRTTARPG